MARRNVLVLCGALAREVLAIVRRAGWEHVEVRCLPASLHSAPQEIPRAVARELEALAGRYEHVFVAYADCGTVGALDRVCAYTGWPVGHVYLRAGEDTLQPTTLWHLDDPARGRPRRGRVSQRARLQRCQLERIRRARGRQRHDRRTLLRASG